MSQVCKRSLIFSFTLLVVIFLPENLYSQNIDEIGISKGVKLSGNLGLSTVGYHASSSQQRRDPFNWFMTGGLNVNLFGYSVPLSFSYSNTNRSFSQPYNQFSFAPQYRWIKTYIGYNSMTLSNYTLAGHVFFGGGVELSPGKWRIAAMRGRLKKAVPYNFADTLQYSDASFRRMGYGLKVGYESNGDAVCATIFTAKDDVGSIPFILPQSSLLPQQNVAFSVNGRKKFFKRFFVDAEYAVSVLNRNTLANSVESDSMVSGGSNFFRGLLPENVTKRYFDAVNTSIGYQGDFYTLQFRFERIAPEYQTLGAYFFNNDMRNITIVPSVRLLHDKVNISANVGLQKNNLDKVRTSTTARTVGSLNATYSPGRHWNFSAAYSNFSSYTNTRPNSDPFFQNNLDTLNFYQVSETLNGSIIRNMGSKDKPQSLTLMVSRQQANEKASYENSGRISGFVTANVGYNYSYVPTNTTITFAANIYSNDAGGVKSTFWGPTLGMTKGFLEKTMRLSLMSTYNESSDKSRTSPVLNNRMNVTWTPKPKEGDSQSHNFSLGVNVMNRLIDTLQQKAYSEMTGTFNYTYSF